MADKLLDKNKAVKHFLDKGYDSELQDGIVYVYYDVEHDPDTLVDVVMSEMKKLNYGCSYGVKQRDNKKSKPAATITEFEGEQESELAEAV